VISNFASDCTFISGVLIIPLEYGKAYGCADFVDYWIFGIGLDGESFLEKKNLLLCSSTAELPELSEYVSHSSLLSGTDIKYSELASSRARLVHLKRHLS